VRTITLQQAANSFYLDRQAHRCSPHTLVWYHAYIDALLAWLDAHGITDLAAVTPDHLRTWLLELHDHNLADRTIHHHAAAARAFFNYCVSEEYIALSPMRKVKMPRLPKDLLPAFEKTDVKALLAACNTDRDRALVLFLLDTGVRAAECCALTVGDVDLQTGSVTIRQGKGKKPVWSTWGPKPANRSVSICAPVTTMLPRPASGPASRPPNH
jgi:site-specific recombinase XerD